MHNAYVVVTVATYLTVMYLGMLVGMGAVSGFTAKDPANDAAYTRRYIATGVSLAVAAALAATYGYVSRAKADRVTYWSTILILLFGGSYAVYQAVPKIPLTAPSGSPEEEETKYQVMFGVHAAALGSAAAAYGLARRFMKPL
tara:strand:+ start:306 stop:734 length:429 start_codon:yes stop_codon:yes gene_type:complete